MFGTITLSPSTKNCQTDPEPFRGVLPTSVPLLSVNIELVNTRSPLISHREVLAIPLDAARRAERLVQRNVPKCFATFWQLGKIEVAAVDGAGNKEIALIVVTAFVVSEAGIRVEGRPPACLFCKSPLRPLPLPVRITNGREVSGRRVNGAV